MKEIRCISCGYDLSAHAMERERDIVCPECGQNDATQEPVPKPRATVLMVMAGVCLLLSVFIAFAAFRVTTGSAIVIVGLAAAASALQGLACVRLCNRLKDRETLLRLKVLVGGAWLLVMVAWTGLLIVGLWRW